MKKEFFTIEGLITTKDDGTQEINKNILDENENTNIKDIFNRNGNDIDKYIFFKNDNQYLEEFPECLASYTSFATNTGLMCFYKDSTLVVYDLTEENKNINLNSVTPDISFFTDYNYISTPLNIRKINYKGNKFIADKTYTYNNEIYSFFNCDKIEDINTSNNNGYFISNPQVDAILYEFKPVISIRAFNYNGEKNESLNIKINNIKLENKNGIYSYDCSNLIENDIKYLLKLSGTINGRKIKVNDKLSVENNKLKVDQNNIKNNTIISFPDLILTLEDNITNGYLEVM